jgi:hypothetical protein
MKSGFNRAEGRPKGAVDENQQESRKLKSSHFSTTQNSSCTKDPTTLNLFSV